MIEFGFDPETTASIRSHLASGAVADNAIGSDSIVEAMQNFIDNEMGDIVVQTIRGILGTDEMHLTLHPEYSARKLENPFVYHVPGKSADQPGILSGALYNSISFAGNAAGVNLIVSDVRGTMRAKGYQFADDPKAYIEKVKALDLTRHERKKRMGSSGYGDRRAVMVKTYAMILESRTGFMTRGAYKAGQIIAARLERTLLFAIKTEMIGFNESADMAAYAIEGGDIIA